MFRSFLLYHVLIFGKINFQKRPPIVHHKNYSQQYPL